MRIAGFLFGVVSGLLLGVAALYLVYLGPVELVRGALGTPSRQCDPGRPPSPDLALTCVAHVRHPLGVGVSVAEADVLWSVVPSDAVPEQVVRTRADVVGRTVMEPLVRYEMFRKERLR